MSSYSIIDRLIHKPVRITLTPEQLSQLSYGDHVIYKDEEGKMQSGEYLGYDTGQGKKATYIAKFSEKQIKESEAYQLQADTYFTQFEKKFGKLFPTSKPLCARMHYTGRQIYFYFHAETRYNFSEFVKAFRSIVPMRFFIYQVGPRDRVRLHPNHQQRFDPSGLPLMYSIFKHPLPNVENDAVMVQGLAGRDVESLKDRSGKFDHTLNFEKDRYEEQCKKYPRRGEIINWNGSSMKCMGCNILTQEIKLKGKSDETSDRFGGEWKVVHYDEYLQCIHTSSYGRNDNK